MHLKLSWNLQPFCFGPNVLTLSMRATSMVLYHCTKTSETLTKIVVPLNPPLTISYIRQKRHIAISRWRCIDADEAATVSTTKAYWCWNFRFSTIFPLSGIWLKLMWLNLVISSNNDRRSVLCSWLCKTWHICKWDCWHTTLSTWQMTPPWDVNCIYDGHTG